MAIRFLKKAKQTASSGEGDIRAKVEALLAEIAAGGEDCATRLCRELDGWQGDIVDSGAAWSEAERHVPNQLKDDIQLAHSHVRRFAEAQRAAIRDVELEIMPGLIAGHRNLPLETAGCYVPGGSYTHIASAIISVTTARVGGVRTIVACSPPRSAGGIHPAQLYALKVSGADRVLNLGGLQAIAAMAFGLFGAPKADILCGPGNQFVAEAKRLLYGHVAIDMFAGPTESLVIADASADSEIVAADLVGQAEHGYNSPVWLIAMDENLARSVIIRVVGH